MADKKISALTASALPLAGTEVLPIVQSGATVKVSVANLTAGRAISATQATLSTGNAIIETAAKGSDFSANTNAPGMVTELLNWYEVGIFTPAFTSTGATIPLALAKGVYTRIGQLVTVSMYMQVSSVSGTTTNALTITGLPFASVSGTEYGFSAAIGVHQFTAITPSMFMDQSSTSINVYQAGTVTTMKAASLAAGYYLVTISYLTNQAI